MKFLQTYNERNDIILEKINIKSMLKSFRKSFNKKKVAKMIIVSLLSVYSVTQAANYIKETELEREEKEILLQELDLESNVTDLDIDDDEIVIADNIEPEEIKKEPKQEEKVNNEYKDPMMLKFSQEGWDHLRYDEGSIKHKGEPVLTVYALKDGKKTVGWGHAESFKNSKLKVGQKITKAEAQAYFVKDVNRAAKGVKRLFKKWKKQGIDIKLTQNQYDVLVSLAFNKGVGGLYKANYIQELKKGNYKVVAELIEKEGNNSKWGGVKKRRHKESKKFLT